jgi:NADP-dependent 3-hydroxy acid dehydrogenase YdfG
MNRLIAFDPATGILTAEAGITLAQILDFAVPRGFFLPVTPGTKYVTLGGAIANDIHGKNHHVAGTFGNHVTQLRTRPLRRHRRLCSPTENPDWYAATIGGMGLTGSSPGPAPPQAHRLAQDRLRGHPVPRHRRVPRPHPALRTSNTPSAGSTASPPARTSPAASSCRANTPPSPASSSPRPSPNSSSPSTLPASRSTASPSAPSTPSSSTSRSSRTSKPSRTTSPSSTRSTSRPPLEPHVRQNGLLQFQYAIPWEHAREGTIAILREVAKSGLASFLAVLKAFGDIPSPGLMSFPQPGITLALDFPHQARQELPALRAPRRHDPRVRRPPLPRQGRRHDRRPVPDLLPSVAALRPLPRPLITSSFWERVTGAPTAYEHPRRPQTTPASRHPLTKLTKKILVLGATSGIAEATCRIWASQGAQLFLVARNPEKLAAVAADLKHPRRSLRRHRRRRPRRHRQARRAARPRHQLAHRHGRRLPRPWHPRRPAPRRAGLQHAAQIIHTNFVAPVSLLTWLANFCVQRHAGVLAVISSVAGDRGRKSNYLYGSSKAGLTAFLGGLRNRIDREGVTVLTIKPGPVKTAMTAAMKGSRSSPTSTKSPPPSSKPSTPSRTTSTSPSSGSPSCSSSATSPTASSKNSTSEGGVYPSVDRGDAGDAGLNSSDSD